jgi:hypothetical protein
VLAWFGSTAPVPHPDDPGARQIRQHCQVALGRQPLGLEAAHLAARCRRTIEPLAVDDRPHGWITGEPLGVVDVLVSGEPPKHRSPKQSAQRVTPVLAAAAIEELTEVVVPRALFAEVLRRIDRLRPRPPPLPA